MFFKRKEVRTRLRDIILTGKVTSYQFEVECEYSARRQKGDRVES